MLEAEFEADSSQVQSNLQSSRMTYMKAERDRLAQDEQIKKDEYNVCRNELQEIWDKLVSVKSYIIEFRGEIENSKIECIENDFEPENINSGGSLKEFSLDSATRMATIQVMKDKIRLRDALKIKAAALEEKLSKTRRELLVLSDNIKMLNQTPKAAATAEGIRRTMEIRHAILESSKQLEAQEEEYINCTGRLEMLESEVTTILQSQQSTEVFGSGSELTKLTLQNNVQLLQSMNSIYESTMQRIIDAPRQQDADTWQLSDRATTTTATANSSSMLSTSLDPMALDVLTYGQPLSQDLMDAVKSGRAFPVVDSHDIQRLQAYAAIADATTGGSGSYNNMLPSFKGEFSLQEILSGQAKIYRMNGELPRTYLERLQRRLSSVLVMHTQLQMQFNEKFQQLKLLREQVREAEVKRLRVELHISQLYNTLVQQSKDLAASSAGSRSVGGSGTGVASSAASSVRSSSEGGADTQEQRVRSVLKKATEKSLFQQFQENLRETREMIRDLQSSEDEATKRPAAVRHIGVPPPASRAPPASTTSSSSRQQRGGVAWSDMGSDADTAAANNSSIPQGGGRTVSSATANEVLSHTISSILEELVASKTINMNQNESFIIDKIKETLLQHREELFAMAEHTAASATLDETAYEELLINIKVKLLSELLMQDLALDSVPSLLSQHRDANFQARLHHRRNNNSNAQPSPLNSPLLKSALSSNAATGSGPGGQQQQKTHRYDNLSMTSNLSLSDLNTSLSVTNSPMVRFESPTKQSAEGDLPVSSNILDMSAQIATALLYDIWGRNRSSGESSSALSRKLSLHSVDLLNQPVTTPSSRTRCGSEVNEATLQRKLLHHIASHGMETDTSQEGIASFIKVKLLNSLLIQSGAVNANSSNTQGGARGREGGGGELKMTSDVEDAVAAQQRTLSQPAKAISHSINATATATKSGTSSTSTPQQQSMQKRKKATVFDLDAGDSDLIEIKRTPASTPGATPSRSSSRNNSSNKASKSPARGTNSTAAATAGSSHSNSANKSGIAASATVSRQQQEQEEGMLEELLDEYDPQYSLLSSPKDDIAETAHNLVDRKTPLSAKSSFGEDTNNDSKERDISILDHKPMRFGKVVYGSASSVVDPPVRSGRKFPPADSFAGDEKLAASAAANTNTTASAAATQEAAAVRDDGKPAHDATITKCQCRWCDPSDDFAYNTLYDRNGHYVGPPEMKPKSPESNPSTAAVATAGATASNPGSRAGSPQNRSRETNNNNSRSKPSAAQRHAANQMLANGGENTDSDEEAFEAAKRNATTVIERTAARAQQPLAYSPRRQKKLNNRVNNGSNHEDRATAPKPSSSSAPSWKSAAAKMSASAAAGGASSSMRSLLQAGQEESDIDERQQTMKTKRKISAISASAEKQPKPSPAYTSAGASTGLSSSGSKIPVAVSRQQHSSAAAATTPLTPMRSPVSGKIQSVDDIVIMRRTTPSTIHDSTTTPYSAQQQSRQSNIKTRSVSAERNISSASKASSAFTTTATPSTLQQPPWKSPSPLKKKLSTESVLSTTTRQSAANTAGGGSTVMSLEEENDLLRSTHGRSPYRGCDVCRRRKLLLARQKRDRLLQQDNNNNSSLQQGTAAEEEEEEEEEDVLLCEHIGNVEDEFHMVQQGTALSPIAKVNGVVVQKKLSFTDEKTNSRTARQEEAEDVASMVNTSFDLLSEAIRRSKENLLHSASAARISNSSGGGGFGIHGEGGNALDALSATKHGESLSSKQELAMQILKQLETLSAEIERQQESIAKSSAALLIEQQAPSATVANEASPSVSLVLAPSLALPETHAPAAVDVASLDGTEQTALREYDGAAATVAANSALASLAPIGLRNAEEAAVETEDNIAPSTPEHGNALATASSATAAAVTLSSAGHLHNRTTTTSSSTHITSTAVVNNTTSQSLIRILEQQKTEIATLRQSQQTLLTMIQLDRNMSSLRAAQSQLKELLSASDQDTVGGGSRSGRRSGSARKGTAAGGVDLRNSEEEAIDRFSAAATSRMLSSPRRGGGGDKNAAGCEEQQQLQFEGEEPGWERDQSMQQQPDVLAFQQQQQLMQQQQLYQQQQMQMQQQSHQQVVSYHHISLSLSDHYLLQLLSERISYCRQRIQEEHAQDDAGIAARIGYLEIVVIQAKNLPEMKKLTRSADSYVELSLLQHSENKDFSFDPSAPGGNISLADALQLLQQHQLQQQNNANISPLSTSPNQNNRHQQQQRGFTFEERNNNVSSGSNLNTMRRVNSGNSNHMLSAATATANAGVCIPALLDEDVVVEGTNKTTIQRNTLFPEWREYFKISGVFSLTQQSLLLTVKDAAHLGHASGSKDEVIGQYVLSFSLEMLQDQHYHTIWIPLKPPLLRKISSGKVSNNVAVKIKVKLFYSMQQFWQREEQDLERIQEILRRQSSAMLKRTDLEKIQQLIAKHGAGLLSLQDAQQQQQQQQLAGLGAGMMGVPGSLAHAAPHALQQQLSPMRGMHSSPPRQHLQLQPQHAQQHAYPMVGGNLGNAGAGGGGGAFVPLIPSFPQYPQTQQQSQQQPYMSMGQFHPAFPVTGRRTGRIDIQGLRERPRSTTPSQTSRSIGGSWMPDQHSDAGMLSGNDTSSGILSQQQLLRQRRVRPNLVPQYVPVNNPVVAARRAVSRGRSMSGSTGTGGGGGLDSSPSSIAPSATASATAPRPMMDFAAFQARNNIGGGVASMPPQQQAAALMSELSDTQNTDIEYGKRARRSTTPNTMRMQFASMAGGNNNISGLSSGSGYQLNSGGAPDLSIFKRSGGTMTSAAASGNNNNTTSGSNLNSSSRKSTPQHQRGFR